LLNVVLAMEVVTEYASRKAELEERIRALEAEKASLIADIASLKEKIATFELEKAASALQSEVESLRTEKAVLEEKAATYEAVSGYEIPTGVPE
jgi:chromosome segregation ATPase